MLDHSPTSAPSDTTPAVPSMGAAAHVRAAALVAALLPLAQIAAAPVTVSAQCSGGCPTTTGSVPEPATLLLLAPAAVWLIRRQARK